MYMTSYKRFMYVQFITIEKFVPRQFHGHVQQKNCSEQFCKICWKTPFRASLKPYQKQT